MSDQAIPKIRIAVVDDEKMILNVFSSLMHQFNYDAECFSNPLKALEVILSKPDRYQVIISDIHMPEMEGIDLAKKVREVLPKMPFIFMTGADVSDQMKKEALELGHVAFLTKPFPLVETLKEVIPKFLGQF